MSNTVINWRIWAYHFQVVRWGDWASYRASGLSPVSWRYNDFHGRGGRFRRRGWWSPVAFYEGKRYAAALAVLIALAIWAAM